MPIQAVQHVRKMRGGAQSHLMRCADGYHYAVKFANNPQHPRVLVNDWLGTRLAEMIGLPVPVPAIVDVHPWLVERTPDLRVELCGQRAMFTAGLSFGSRYVVSPLEGQVYDYLPEGMLGRVRNIDSFAGVSGPIPRHHGCRPALANLPWRSCGSRMWSGQNPDRPGHDVCPCATPTVFR